MTLLSIKDLSCTQGIKTLFEKATVGIEEQDKVAIVGPNGCGKSTLLSLIESAAYSPNPHIAIQQGVRFTSLKQTPVLDLTHTISEHLYQSDAKASSIIRTYYQDLERYNLEPNLQSETALGISTEKMDNLNLWDYEDRIKIILNELDINNLNQQIKGLSGGMRKKISLAQTFFAESELLILDEPTNHLDIATIEWLEEQLKRRRGAILMVTHDRYFLDKICTKIIEIDQQQVFVYNGNYQTYLEQREQRYLRQEKQESSLQAVLRVELAWLKRGPKARSTKQKARKERITSMMSCATIQPEDTLALNVSERRLGKKVLVLKNVSKSFLTKTVIHDFSYAFKKGDKLGILGPNGAGKTTLLNLIMEQLEPDKGTIEVGVNTVFSYFDQHSQCFDLELTIYEHVTDIGSHFTRPDGVKVSAAKLLETFLFPSCMLKTPIKKLSGGERRRLHLVSLLLKNPNFLLFDEPTNDLDIQTLSVLEDFLNHFSGCVVIISHDRYFMDRVIDNLLIIKEHGHIDTFQGSYSEYIDSLKGCELAPKKSEKSNSVSQKKENNEFKREVKNLEKDIERIEKKIQVLNVEYTDLCYTDTRYKSVGKEIKALTISLDEAMEKWESIAEMNEY